MFTIVKSANHDNISSTLYNNETCEYLKPCQHGFIIVPKSEIDIRCWHIYIIIWNGHIDNVSKKLGQRISML